MIIWIESLTTTSRRVAAKRRIAIGIEIDGDWDEAPKGRVLVGQQRKSGG